MQPLETTTRIELLSDLDHITQVFFAPVRQEVAAATERFLGVKITDLPLLWDTVMKLSPGEERRCDVEKKLYALSEDDQEESIWGRFDEFLSLSEELGLEPLKGESWLSFSSRLQEKVKTELEKQQKETPRSTVDSVSMLQHEKSAEEGKEASGKLGWLISRGMSVFTLLLTMVSGAAAAVVVAKQGFTGTQLSSSALMCTPDENPLGLAALGLMSFFHCPRQEIIVDSKRQAMEQLFEDMIGCDVEMNVRSASGMSALSPLEESTCASLSWESIFGQQTWMTIIEPKVRAQYERWFVQLIEPLSLVDRQELDSLLRFKLRGSLYEIDQNFMKGDALRQRCEECLVKQFRFAIAYARVKGYPIPLSVMNEIAQLGSPYGLAVTNKFDFSALFRTIAYAYGIEGHSTIFGFPPFIYTLLHEATHLYWAKMAERENPKVTRFFMDMFQSLGEKRYNEVISAELTNVYLTEIPPSIRLEMLLALKKGFDRVRDFCNPIDQKGMKFIDENFEPWFVIRNSEPFFSVLTTQQKLLRITKAALYCFGVFRLDELLSPYIPDLRVIWAREFNASADPHIGRTYRLNLDGTRELNEEATVVFGGQNSVLVKKIFPEAWALVQAYDPTLEVRAKKPAPKQEVYSPPSAKLGLFKPVEKERDGTPSLEKTLTAARR